LISRKKFLCSSSTFVSRTIWRSLARISSVKFERIIWELPQTSKSLSCSVPQIRSMAKKSKSGSLSKFSSGKSEWFSPWVTNGIFRNDFLANFQKKELRFEMTLAPRFARIRKISTVISLIFQIPLGPANSKPKLGSGLGRA
jgi:hypothetical protein